MSVQLALLLVQAYVVAMASPGPDIFILMRMAAVHRRSAVAAAAGIILGNCAWIVLSVLGLSAALSTHPSALAVVQLGGAAVLTWMAIGMFRSGLAHWRTGTPMAATSLTEHPFRSGLMTNLANAKALIFYGAFLAAFLPPDPTIATQLSIIGLMIVTCTVWFITVALVMSLPLMRRVLLRIGPLLDLAGGVLFIGIAIYLLVGAISGLSA